ncbi:MAG: hypothetical protein OIN89_08125 [Candidatus Methanoperedens sp.]|jgi:HSP20 family molecular chaperone IbpA|nr:hypothetical protein [Candidatus Methanoperedens sp.]PKL53438.1 MAG: hypothetical protein CVV36_07170 [Candidatus Methanoperedenaceae archaeon HGW-Methanoperedenaceae-1]
MKKRNDFDELLRQLEEALEGIINEIEIPQDRPVSIDVSINMCPYMVFDGVQDLTRSGEKTQVDILETEKSVHVVAGIPGMEQEDIELNCTGWGLEITASNPVKTVKEIVQLPVRVNKTGMKTTYRNGILEVVFNKSKRKAQEC